MTQPEQPAQQLPPIAPQPTQEQRPQAQQRPSLRPRSRSGFSFRSHKSQDSYGSTPKVEIQETPREKAARRLSTKADPRLAMSEAQPSDIANDHSTRLASLRAIQHRDTYGLPIADPDRSNPTRSRWERPLDTIRSFEAAIDGNYARKSGRYDGAIESRRSSYYGGSTMGPRNHQGNGYGGRGQSYRNDGYANGNGSRPDSYYYDNNNSKNGYFPNRSRYPRNDLEPALNTMAGVYPPNGNAQSYETVTTAAGSGSSAEPLGYSTDPSSDNSSFDRVAPISKADYGNNSPSNGQYGYQSNQQQYPVGGVQQGHQAAGYPSQKNGPLPPVKDREPPRVPIKLGKSAPGAPTQQYDPPKAAPDKPKSWFSKRFSKS
ncbi:hypothetical protein GMDG_01640 [Pseudogymnoascus destructans 20631-21]|uniref:DUF2406 domain-containing protein n=1 Tax=Pseudogymnoascus destructans (strain ATCC MYA-4855 / 20631-21) TaxID=658429 RepID=L8FVS6_PSED2|nr:hypothetical protein GMDG_01640 [Pseudogymnoascus destructans 20631-21]